MKKLAPLFPFRTAQRILLLTRRLRTHHVLPVLLICFAAVFGAGGIGQGARLAYAAFPCQYSSFVAKDSAQDTQRDVHGTYRLTVELRALVDIHNTGIYCGSEMARATLAVPPGGLIQDYVLSLSVAGGATSAMGHCPCGAGQWVVQTSSLRTSSGYAGGGASNDADPWVLAALTGRYP